MKRRRVWGSCFAAILMVTTPFDSREATACGPGYEILAQTVTYPDLPHAPFAAGQLGVLQPTLARTYLVVAYRHLTEVGMDATEQGAVLSRWDQRLHFTPPKPPDVAGWIAARNAVAQAPIAEVSTALTRNYAQIENCLRDAFDRAQDTLAARVQAYGIGSQTVTHFIAGQDAAFANCSGGPPVIPPPLVDATALERADRAYHRAAAQFYALQHDDAVQSFEAIAADASSPWQITARYVVARALIRKATLSDHDIAQAALRRAQDELEALLADPRAASMHPAAQRLLDRARFYGDPQAQTRRLAVTLATQRLGADLGRILVDYTRLVDRHGLPSATDDRLSAWIGVVQSDRSDAFETASRLYHTTRAPVWLVAAAMKASSSAGDTNLKPLLAATLPVDHPGYATLRFHQARLLGEQGLTEQAYAITEETMQALDASMQLSTRAAFTQAALAFAPSAKHALRHLVLRPALETSDGIPTSSARPPAIHPQAAAYLSALPLDELANMAKHDLQPSAVLDRFVTVVWLRAELLGRTDLSEPLRARVVQGNPELADDIGRVHAAHGNERRLALNHLMLTAPNLSPVFEAWDEGSWTKAPIDSAYGGYWWCGDPGTPVATWLTAKQRRQAEAELQTFTRAGASFVVEETVRLAHALPDDSRIPELLHLSVRGTRFGCRDDETTQHSAAAFRWLHQHYPDDPYTKKTPYYY